MVPYDVILYLGTFLYQDASLASSSHESGGSTQPASSASGPVSFQLGEPGLLATDLEVVAGNVDFELAFCVTVSDSDWVELDCGLGNTPSDCSLGDITCGCRLTEMVPGGGGLSTSLAGSLAWNSGFLSPAPWIS